MRFGQSFALAIIFLCSFTAHADTVYSIGISTSVQGAPAEYSFSFDTAQVQVITDRVFATQSLTGSLSTTVPPAIDSVEVEFGSDGSTPFLTDETNQTTVFFGGNSTALDDISRLIAGTYNVEIDDQPMGASVGQSTVTISEMTTPSSTAVTPEPSTLLLFSTGLLGIAGNLRQRFN